ncbi:hypothetical protein L6452_36638 [Arctium lappa]|uniref:Uncharacterized protein n=1 Tax=Arctium lappa TaxID=4217 RepID=A0ACB8YDY7_ARCLA|nr:hypothetical protein L6452_36638 [Arctium lappa]
MFFTSGDYPFPFSTCPAPKSSILQGTIFSMTELDRLELRGLQPSNVVSNIVLLRNLQFYRLVARSITSNPAMSNLKIKKERRKEGPIEAETWRAEPKSRRDLSSGGFSGIGPKLA